MKLKLLYVDRPKYSTALIGKTGVLRFNRESCRKFNFNKTDRWVLAIDEDEQPIKSIFLIKLNEHEKIFGNKMKLLNGKFSFDGSILLENLNLKLPVRCKIEDFKRKDFSGICLLLP